MTKNELLTIGPRDLMALNMMEWKNFMAVIKAASALRQQAATFDYRVGDKVKFQGRWGKEVTGTVTKVNRTTISVDAGSEGTWRVGSNLLTKI